MNEAMFAAIEARQDILEGEKELFMVFTAYTTCVSLVVQHFDAEEPGTSATKEHLKSQLTACVETWIEEHPDVRPSVRQKLRAVHQNVLVTSEIRNS